MKKKFTYALGEILIVIVGISIAFTMNKCSENSKSEALKQQYLENIKSDIEIDKKNLKSIFQSIDKKIETLNTVLPLINTDNPEKHSKLSTIYTVFTSTDFFPKDVTYQTMINSGDFKLIDDFNLKTAIENHYSNYKIMLKDYERLDIIHKEYLGKYMIENVDFDIMKKGQFGYNNEKLFKNILQSVNGALMIKRRATEQGIKSCDSLLKILP
ncbi:hypothetical protein EVU94_01225 [Flavobacteriaceae bacterium 144Ye]|uniref:DUF6090 family protein n=1 Tax=Gaetbulibacter sp. NE TaxID=2982307 RepID=UPI00101CE556|nr:DUF6090 family protein [Gaetbulibacter sp. NE]RYH75610.1 hypothetical protein EVU94_01225 [Flavobacteriaceae bacterium 144Ye]